jgi:hypothetical protein
MVVRCSCRLREGKRADQVHHLFLAQWGKRAKFAAAFNCWAAGSLEEMLATPGLDGVIVTMATTSRCALFGDTNFDKLPTHDGVQQSCGPKAMNGRT